MKQTSSKLALLGQAPVPRALLALGLPAMAGMLINALYNLADAYFVSGLGNSAMAAISVVFPLGQAVVGLGLLFGSGAASCLSRLLGRGEREKADQVASTALYGSLLAGGAVILCAALFLTPLLRLLGASESVLPYARTYGRLYILSCILNVGCVVMNNITTSEGASKTAMCALLAGAGLNIVLDPVLIYALDWGVSGAAIATAVSQALSALVYLGYIRSGRSAFRFRVKDLRPSRAILSEIFKIGLPTLVFQLLTSLSIALINQQSKPYGDGAVAAMGAATRVISMGSLVVFGFLKGFQAVAGYSYGAGDLPRLREAIRTARRWSGAVCLLFGGAAALLAEPVIARFAGGGADFLSVGVKALRAMGLSFVVFGFGTVYAFLFLALGKAGRGLVLGACRQGLCFVPLILLFPRLWGMDGVVYAQPAADLLTALAAALMAAGLHRELEG